MLSLICAADRPLGWKGGAGMSAQQRHGLESAALVRYAREAPETPVAEVLSQAAITVIRTLVVGERLLPPAERDCAPPGDIRTWVVWLARTSGFRPSKRRPLPGARVLGRACESVRMLADWEQMKTSGLERQSGPSSKPFRTESLDETDGT